MQGKPASERWNVEKAEIVSGVPWSVGPEEEKAEGEMPQVINLSDDDIEKMGGRHGLPWADESVPRHA